MIVYRARTKAGRAWIETILASAIRIDIVEIDLLTDRRSSRTLWRAAHTQDQLPALLRELFSDRYTELYDQCNGGSSTYVALTTSGRTATRYEITTYAFDATDLPVVPQEDA